MSRAGLTIRRPLSSDLDELVRLCAAHAAHERAEYDATGKAEALAGLILGEAPRIQCRVAAGPGGLAGYATWTYDASTWEARLYAYMDCLFLDPAFRNQGLGRRLMAHVARSVIESGCGQLQWHTPDFNEGAMRFYDRLGTTRKDKVRYFLDDPALTNLAGELPDRASDTGGPGDD
jgi:ribosomal protein S18 acetylase RimI-like enzyme